MNRFIPLLGVVTIALSGCSGSDYKNASPSPMQPAAQQDFTAFVVSQYTPAATTEIAGPIAVDTTNFTFGDNDNPAAFNSIIATAP